MGVNHAPRKSRANRYAKCAPLTPEARAARVLMHSCPTCHVPAGDLCRDDAGNTLTDNGAHRARRALAEVKVTT